MQTPDFSQFSKEQDKEPSQQKQLSAEEYTWSTKRVMEQVTINVASAGIIGILTLLIAVAGSFFLWLFHVIPANWLLVVIAIFAGMIVMLLILAFLWWLVFRKRPGIIMGALMGALIFGSMFDRGVEAL